MTSPGQSDEGWNPEAGRQGNQCRVCAIVGHVAGGSESARLDPLTAGLQKGIHVQNQRAYGLLSDVCRQVETDIGVLPDALPR